MSTLRMLVWADGAGNLDDLLWLAWTGQPENAYRQGDGRDILAGDIELGDEDMDPIPSTPDAPGLWLLEWDYAMKPCEEQWSDDEDAEEMTPKYAPTCIWRRPTLDDLRRLNALSTE